MQGEGGLDFLLDLPEAVAIRDGGLATSSTAVRRWRAAGSERHHIIDPHTGLPALSELLKVAL